jgi:hypothetical protein
MVKAGAHSRTLVSTVLLISSIAIATSTNTQGQPGLEPGVHVRLWSFDLPDREINGRLVFLTRDTITLNQVEYRTLDPILSLPLTQVGRIDVSMGRNRLVIGASIAGGALVGAVLVPALTQESVGCQVGYADSHECSGETTDVVIGLAAGAIAGMMFSDLIAKERWAHVRMDVLLQDGSVRFHSRVSVPVPHVF